MTEPERCATCGEVHGPDNPIRQSEYERHGLLEIDQATMPAFDPVELLSEMQVALVIAWQDLEGWCSHPVLEWWIRKWHPEWLADKTYVQYVEEQIAYHTEELQVATAALRLAEGDAAVAEAIRYAETSGVRKAATHGDSEYSTPADNSEWDRQSRKLS